MPFVTDLQIHFEHAFNSAINMHMKSTKGKCTIIRC